MDCFKQNECHVMVNSSIQMTIVGGCGESGGQVSVMPLSTSYMNVLLTLYNLLCV